MKRYAFVAATLGVWILSGLATVPAMAQQGAVWNVEYHDNSFLLGQPVVEQRSSSIAFDWGSGAPAAGMPADNFSVRFGTDVFIPAGTYRFFALADDSIKIILDFGFHPLLNTFDNPRPGELITADVMLTGDVHHIQVDYRENSGPAFIFVDWQNVADNPTGPRFAVPPQRLPVNNGMWTAQYYGNASLSGAPTAILAETQPSHDWGVGSPVASVPADNFSARWTSFQNIPTAGQYEINVRADDGVRVWVDGVVVIDEFHGFIDTTYTTTLDLTAGPHNFMIEYFEAGGSAFMEFQLFQLIPAGGQPQPVQPAAALWTAEYFNNTSLFGAPTLMQVENSPNHDWGSGSPGAGISADNFSARWRSTQTLTGGMVQINVRADDGVRVIVDGQRVIDEFHLATEQTYSASLDLSAGPHTFVIEFVEAFGVAFLDYELVRVGVAQTSATFGTVTVDTGRLNVRSIPSTEGRRLTVIERGATYPVVGRNADGSWWEILVDGTRGWVFGALVRTLNTENAPVTDMGAAPQVALTGFTLTANTTVRIRSGPGTGTAIKGSLPAGRTAAMAGRSADGNWWQIEFSGVVGWVSAGFVSPQAGIDINRVPITG